MSEAVYDVAIVGMGPVGAAGAICFADAGLSVAVIEKAPEIYPLPRAVAMDGEIVRAFQKMGRAEALASHLQALRPGDRAGFAGADRQWMFGQDMVPFASNGWQSISMFDQPELERYLRDTVAEYERVDVFLGEEVQSIKEVDDRVTLKTADRTVGCRYVVACDGAASPTRKALGINWRDLGYDHDWLVIDIVMREGYALGNDTVQVCDPDRLATYVVTKDPYRRWEFKLNDGETAEQMLEDEAIYRLLDEWTPRDTYELRRKAVYQFHAATADSWRRGRVLIGGDAAHQTPPFLGQGMNAGMRDVINLAWKLPLVLEGVTDDTLLDTYESERLPHAEDLVDWAVAIGQLMEHLAAVEAAKRQGRTPPEVPEQKRSAGYGQGREAPPLRDGVILVEQVSDTGSTGYLFQQPIVRHTDGREFRLDEALGGGFALVSRGPLELDEAAQAIAERLPITLVPLADLSLVRGHFDRLFEQCDAALVRPDRYVFGHTTDDLDASALVARLANALGLKKGPA
jgi:3-(3-hydroxy-phenyl)propionate hydroxylase